MGTTCHECDALATVRDAWSVPRCSMHHAMEYATPTRKDSAR